MKKVFLMLVLGAFITSCGPSLCDCRNLNKKEKKDKIEGKFLDDFTKVFSIVASALTTVLLAQRL